MINHKHNIKHFFVTIVYLSFELQNDKKQKCNRKKQYLECLFNVREARNAIAVARPGMRKRFFDQADHGKIGEKVDLQRLQETSSSKSSLLTYREATE